MAGYLAGSPDLRETFEAGWHHRARRPMAATFGEGRWILAYQRLDQGRVREARALFAELQSEKGSRPAAEAQIHLHLLGYADTAAARLGAEELETETAPYSSFWLGALSAHQGDRVAAEGAATRLETRSAELAAAGDTAEARTTLAYATALRGYAALRRRAPEEGVRLLSEALPRLPSIGPGSGVQRFVRFQIGRTLLESGHAREAERYFLSFGLFDAEYVAPREHFLGRVYEALGDREAARRHHERFVRWWDRSDAEVRPWWEESRRAVERLSFQPLPG